MLMLKEAVPLGRNAKRKNHIFYIVHPEHAKPLCEGYGFTQ